MNNPTIDDYLTEEYCSCGKKAVIKTRTSSYCIECWHKYPEGFMTTGWDFI